MMFNFYIIYFHLTYILHGHSIMGLFLVPSKILLKGLDVASLCSGCPVTEGKPRSGCGVWSVGAAILICRFLFLIFF